MAFSSLTRHIANAIGACVVDTQVPVANLNYNQFFRWLADEGATETELARYKEHLRQMGGFADFKRSFYPSYTTSEVQEKAEIKALAKEQKTLVVEAASQQQFLAKFESAMTRALAQGLISPQGYAKIKPKKGQVERVLNVMLSDLHLGAQLSKEEVLDDYDFVQEARRLASIVKRVCEYKQDYRKSTELVVNLGGDIIESQIHDPSGHCVAVQVADAVYLLAQALRIFCNNYRKVTVKGVGGNHDRNAQRHPHGAVQAKYDSEAVKIYTSLRTALMDYKNIEFDIPMRPFAEYEVFGSRIYMTHGDNNFDPGSIGAVINTSQMEKQINRINVAMASRGEKPFSVFVVGHVHVGSLIHLPGAELITNAAMTPPNAFGLSISHYISGCGQTLWESTPGHPVGDYRFLQVDQKTDADASLDKIIKPFPGL